MTIFIVLLETTDDPSEVVEAYTDEKRAEEKCDELNRVYRGGFSSAVVKRTELIT